MTDMTPTSSILKLVADLGVGLSPETPAEQAAREARQAERERQATAAADLASREVILRERSVPAKHRALILAGEIDETPALTRARTWLADERRLLALVGVPDAGKTTAASWAAAQEPSTADLRLWTPRIGLPAVVFIPAEFLAGAWQARGVHYQGKERIPVPERDPITRRCMSDLCDCWLLVIDDLGQEPGVVSDMVGDIVDILLRRRSDAGFRTLITSNLATRAALEQRYPARGQRLYETFLEYGYFTPVPPEGRRRRRTA